MLKKSREKIKKDKKERIRSPQRRKRKTTRKDKRRVHIERQSPFYGDCTNLANCDGRGQPVLQGLPKLIRIRQWEYNAQI